MNYRQARKLASETSIWFFQNNKIKDDSFSINKKSDKNTKLPDDIWARLMTEAILSFNEGLDLPPEKRVASRDKELFEATVDMIGSDAFEDIAFIVSAAGVRRPIEEEVEQSFTELQQAPAGQATGFTGVEGLSGLISNNADAQAYGKASTVIMQIESSAPSQGLYHQSAQQLQQIASTPGLSQPFARALSSLGAEYMQMADELTRQSGEGQMPGVGPGISGLPTGVHVGSWQRRLKAIRQRIIKEARKAA